MVKVKYAVIIGMALFFSACSQCSLCNEARSPIVDMQCPHKVETINYTDGCGSCSSEYPVTVRKSNCHSAQGCDK